MSSKAEEDLQIMSGALSVDWYYCSGSWRDVFGELSVIQKISGNQAGSNPETNENCGYRTP